MFSSSICSFGTSLGICFSLSLSLSLYSFDVVSFGSVDEEIISFEEISFKRMLSSLSLLVITLSEGDELIFSFSFEDGIFEITTEPENFSAVREALEGSYTLASAEVTMVPQTTTELTGEDDIKNMNKLLEMLEDNDDVQNIYHNWEETE